MVFYHQNLSSITPEVLTDTILCNCETPNILYLHFNDTPETATLHDALSIIDKKRECLLNPNRHSFLCLEPVYKKDISPNMMVMAVKHIADVLNAYFNGNLYIISVLYADDDGKIHPLIILSDIERHLQESSQERLLMQDLFHILTELLPEYTIDSLSMDALYLFNGTDLPYDGIIHMKCYINNSVF